MFTPYQPPTRTEPPHGTLLRYDTPYATVPYALAPAVHYEWSRYLNAAGNPVFQNVGSLGDTYDRVGSGGINNPTALTENSGHSYDGVDSFIGGTNPMIGDPTLTYLVWGTTSDLAAIRCAGHIGTSAAALGACGFFLNVAGGGMLSVEYAGGNHIRSAAGVVPSGTPCLFAYTKTPGAIHTTARLFYNGIYLAPSSASITTPNLTAAAGSIGSFQPINLYFWLGILYSWRILWGVALPDEVIYSIYENERYRFAV